MPPLQECFGIVAERTLDRCVWNFGPRFTGRLQLKVHPVPKGQALQYNLPQRYTSSSSYHVRSIDVSIITPQSSLKRLRAELSRRLESQFPDADVCFKLTEDSGDHTRLPIIQVAHSEAGIRWGRGFHRSMPRKTKRQDTFIAEISKALCGELVEEVSLGGAVDEKLQDQLVPVQALTNDLSSFSRDDSPIQSAGGNSLVEPIESFSINDKNMRRDKAQEQFGYGSEHTRLVGWMASEPLPRVEFYSRGDSVRGVGSSIS
ncbi:RNA 3'-terminal phosphate cyclase [Hirsutella rhossiliensis]|uniref:RNA 3'-terminal phosphate cyclase n=1 Tax=Hirsutella rhossiliensis TaxID=111463 RepID=A0A9P8MVE4_9HYPO|nr:RNA 3'-terminal phosphate cyclase [Hirsutella rhossiliensis]KAH0961869.1 RNA 3'-terminal phosphate cyclase [Hirsutella rhossiliensis]